MRTKHKEIFFFLLLLEYYTYTFIFFKIKQIMIEFRYQFRLNYLCYLQFYFLITLLNLFFGTFVQTQIKNQSLWFQSCSIIVLFKSSLKVETFHVSQAQFTFHSQLFLSFLNINSEKSLILFKYRQIIYKCAQKAKSNFHSALGLRSLLTLCCVLIT